MKWSGQVENDDQPSLARRERAPRSDRSPGQSEPQRWRTRVARRRGQVCATGQASAHDNGNGGPGSAQGNGDLVFTNDNGVVSTALAISVWFSVVVFVLEVFAWYNREQLRQLGKEFVDIIPYLLCIHVITEDAFQTVVYAAVGTSHSTVSGAIWMGGFRRCCSWS